MVDTGTTRSGTTTIRIKSSSSAMAILAEILARNVGRVVMDKTGIQGNYDITLKFTSDDAGSAIPSSDGGSPASDSGPSVFAALQEQLGLKLEPRNGPVDVLVIDHAEMPTEN